MAYALYSALKMIKNVLIHKLTDQANQKSLKNIDLNRKSDKIGVSKQNNKSGKFHQKQWEIPPKKVRKHLIPRTVFGKIC